LRIADCPTVRTATSVTDLSGDLGNRFYVHDSE
jgi:hypothetical protein